MPDYRECRPPPELSSLVECVWLLRPAEESRSESPERVFPDGATDIVFTGQTPLVYGPAPSIRFLPCAIHAIGLRLRAGAAMTVLGETPSSLGEQPVPLRSLWHADLSEVEDLMAAGAKTSLLLTSFTSRLFMQPSSVRKADLLVRAVADQLDSPGGMALRAVRARFDLGERQLRRRFLEAMGLGPKHYSRIKRFQRSLDRLRACKRSSGGTRVNWADLAAECGFADQAHLIRETVHFAGLTPGRLLETL